MAARRLCNLHELDIHLLGVRGSQVESSLTLPGRRLHEVYIHLLGVRGSQADT